MKVTSILFTNCKCYLLANPTNWLNIIKATTVFENEHKVEMHFKQSDKTPPLAIKLHMDNLIINETYFICKLIIKSQILRIENKPEIFHFAFF